MEAIFDELNQTHFDGFLERPKLEWNSRLRVSAGRFFPGGRRLFAFYPPRIEVASYLKEEAEALKHIRDTLAHEMVHYWLWVRRRPYGHTAEFNTKIKAIGASRYNPVPRQRPMKYVYRCASCAKEFFVRKKLGTLACAKCCTAYASGRFDRKFQLMLDRQL